jgi:hypothetical protein
MTAAQIAIETQGYTFRELAASLSYYRGKRVPRRTLDNWITQLGIEPDEFGLYSKQEHTTLARLALWLNRGKTIQSFAQIIQKELQRNGN